MQKKTALLAGLIIILIGIWFYLFFTLQKGEESKGIIPRGEGPEVISPAAPPIERYKFKEIEYEIISAGGPTYDIITGQLTKKQTNSLAEKIIDDILAQEPDTREITLLFYSDLIAVGIGQADVAQIDWTPEGINIKIIE